METMSRMEAEGLLKACARCTESPVGVHDGSGENMHEADKHPECPTFMAVVRLI